LPCNRWAKRLFGCFPLEVLLPSTGFLSIRAPLYGILLQNEYFLSVSQADGVTLESKRCRKDALLSSGLKVTLLRPSPLLFFLIQYDFIIILYFIDRYVNISLYLALENALFALLRFHTVISFPNPHSLSPLTSLLFLSQSLLFTYIFTKY